jgi:hypothetical protein
MVLRPRPPPGSPSGVPPAEQAAIRLVIDAYFAAYARTVYVKPVRCASRVMSRQVVELKSRLFLWVSRSAHTGD